MKARLRVPCEDWCCALPRSAPPPAARRPQVVPDRIYDVHFHPCGARLVALCSTKHGHLGVWAPVAGVSGQAGAGGPSRAAEKEAEAEEVGGAGRKRARGGAELGARGGGGRRAAPPAAAAAAAEEEEEGSDEDEGDTGDSTAAIFKVCGVARADAPHSPPLPPPSHLRRPLTRTPSRSRTPRPSITSASRPAPLTASSQRPMTVASGRWTSLQACR